MDERDFHVVYPAGGRSSKTPESPGVILKSNRPCIFKMWKWKTTQTEMWCHNN